MPDGTNLSFSVVSSLEFFLFVLRSVTSCVHSSESSPLDELICLLILRVDSFLTVPLPNCAVSLASRISLGKRPVTLFVLFSLELFSYSHSTLTSFSLAKGFPFIALLSPDAFESFVCLAGFLESALELLSCEKVHAEESLISSVKLNTCTLL